MHPAAARLLVLMLLVLAVACRDEQAGPRPRTPPLPPPGQVRALEAAPSDLTFRSGATFANGAVVYLGARVTPAQAAPGQQVRIAHYFRATRALPERWDFFVHLIDPDSGHMLANLDHPFQGGAAPLGTWPAGKVLEDVHTLVVPPQPARVVLGFWRGEGRLPVDEARAHDGSHRMLGPELGASSRPALPEYVARRTTRPPKLDGVLDEEVWQAATPVVLQGSFDGRPTRLRTEARLAWDDSSLYVAFDVEDPDVWGTYRERDQPLYEQEVVELFIDANADGRTYNEMQVSPHNVLFDAYFPARRQGMDLSWDSGVRSAVRVRGTLDDASDRDEGWTVELQVPFARLAQVPHLPPRRGDKWRFNLYRLEHLERRQVEGQSFSPLFIGDFHALPRFGWLVFDAP